jgi:spore coat polysaccharide biosynthesis protein SpsF
VSAAAATAILVFARLDSRRLPGKTLLPLEGRPILGRVIDRLRRVVPPTDIIVATSDRPLDDPIDGFARAEGVAVFRGALDDVAQRAYDCATSCNLAALVRISADSPFIDPDVIGAVMARFDRGDVDLATNVHPRSFPPGVSVETLATAALGRMLAMTGDSDDREHVTRYIYAHPDLFRIANVAAPEGRYADVSLTVDTEADLAKARWIAGRLGSEMATADLDAVVSLAREWASIQGDKT